ncbi:MAG: hypoxanthine phosphoribosyltransferase [Clostridia bacterium]|nr:hypoxanthine phosphoribosyltransferase [Clostridia bacterium]MBR4032224.1 hypoxanthine phosphoribosyltransferase [Clostridia bacterium]
MLKDIERVLVDEKQIEKINSDLAQKIMKDYENSTKPLIVIVILKGSMIFASDLIKKLDLPLEIEFMKVSSYGAGTKNSGEIKIHLDLARENLEQYDLLIIEDIVDSGRTLSRLTQLLKNRNANSVKTCTLLDKPSRREVPFTPDYCGTEIEDEFVVGYGLDYDEKYRNLPYVAILKREVYS